MDIVFQMVGASFVLVIGMMVILWVVYYFLRNAGVADIGWAFGYIVTVWIFFSLGEGDFLRKWMIAVLVSIWAVRLALYFFLRLISGQEDPRFQSLRESWKDEKIDFKFFILYLVQGLLVIILSIPFLIICLNRTDWSALEGIGVFIWVCGMVGEVFADQQLYRFKQNSENKNRVCQTGLWKYSRHPNYFFEWVIWISYFLIALPAPGGWIAIVAPLIMLYLLTQVSGIPLVEAEALKTKGEAYELYQKTTSRFFPWFPKKIEK